MYPGLQMCDRCSGQCPTCLRLPDSRISLCLTESGTESSGAFPLQNEIMKAALEGCRRVAAIASEEDDSVVVFPNSSDLPFVAVFGEITAVSQVEAR